MIRRTGSVAISTDRLHYSSDLLLNASVIAALVLEQYAGFARRGCAFGLAIAAWLGFGAWRSSSQAINQLMDREWPEEERATFLAAAAEYPELAGLHDLRTRTSGTHHFAQFHVWVPATGRCARRTIAWTGSRRICSAASRAPKSSSTSIPRAIPTARRCCRRI